MRLFVAICFSDEIKALLSSVCQKLKTQSLSGNFTRPENLHMTLAFIGESNRVAAVKSAMQQCTGDVELAAMRSEPLPQILFL